MPPFCADGRISNCSTIAALGWREGDPLHMALVDGSVVAHRDPTGAFRTGCKPYLVLPIAIRRRSGLGPGHQCCCNGWASVRPT